MIVGGHSRPNSSIGAAVAQHLDMVEVTGSSPVSTIMDTFLLLLQLTLPHHGPIIQLPSPTHQAVDIACLRGDPVRAVHGGSLSVRRDPDRGNIAVVTGDRYRSLYAHLERVEKPGPVNTGDVIGWCGSTGRKSLGPHLHLEIGLR